jgi:hypothetical protein
VVDAYILIIIIALMNDGFWPTTMPKKINYLRKIWPVPIIIEVTVISGHLYTITL